MVGRVSEPQQAFDKCSSRPESHQVRSVSGASTSSWRSSVETAGFSSLHGAHFLLGLAFGAWDSLGDTG